MPVVLLFMSVFISIFLIGCGSSEEEIRSFVEKTKASKGGVITSLPKIQNYTSFTYDASLLKSPFQSIDDIVFADVKIDGSPGISFLKQAMRPDADRQREFLEGFSLDNLTMVGTLSKGKYVWGLLVDKNGRIHRVRAGNYLGSNSGKIEKITEGSIYIKELVADGEGGWEERAASLTMKKK